MSEYSTPDERTEKPTGRRMNQLRKKGQIHFSQDASVVLTMVTAFLILRFIWDGLFSDLQYILHKSFSMIASSEPLTIAELHAGFAGILFLVGPEIFAIVLLVATTAILSVMLQTKWNVKEKKIDFNFGKLNPIKGLKKIVSIDGFVKTAKALLKLSIILPIGYITLKKFAPVMVTLVHTSVDTLLIYIGDLMIFLFWKIIYVLIAFAIFDYVWGKYQWLRQNKMTKVEVKDERKARDGDEKTKRRIQMKGLNRIAQRIRQSVPQADVVVTNPTHYAVALKYDKTTMAAPMVVAKGKGFLALKIREIAKEARVPIIERKPLARALYGSAEVGKTIPYELFKAVAEVIAYVYRLKNPWAHGQQQGAK